jgi:hypothetical protein
MALLDESFIEWVKCFFSFSNFNFFCQDAAAMMAQPQRAGGRKF